MPLNNTPTIARVEEVIGQALKGVEVTLLGDINVWLQEPQNAREEELAMVVAACDLEDITDQFLPMRRYKGSGC